MCNSGCGCGAGCGGGCGGHGGHRRGGCGHSGCGGSYESSACGHGCGGLGGIKNLGGVQMPDLGYTGSTTPSPILGGSRLYNELFSPRRRPGEFERSFQQAFGQAFGFGLGDLAARYTEAAAQRLEEEYKKDPGAFLTSVVESLQASLPAFQAALADAPARQKLWLTQLEQLIVIAKANLKAAGIGPRAGGCGGCGGCGGKAKAASPAVADVPPAPAAPPAEPAAPASAGIEDLRAGVQRIIDSLGQPLPLDGEPLKEALGQLKEAFASYATFLLINSTSAQLPAEIREMLRANASELLTFGPDLENPAAVKEDIEGLQEAHTRLLLLLGAHIRASAAPAGAGEDVCTGAAPTGAVEAPAAVPAPAPSTLQGEELEEARRSVWGTLSWLVHSFGPLSVEARQREAQNLLAARAFVSPPLAQALESAAAALMKPTMATPMGEHLSFVRALSAVRAAVAREWWPPTSEEVASKSITPDTLESAAVKLTHEFAYGHARVNEVRDADGPPPAVGPTLT